MQKKPDRAAVDQRTPEPAHAEAACPEPSLPLHRPRAPLDGFRRCIGPSATDILEIMVAELLELPSAACSASPFGKSSNARPSHMADLAQADLGEGDERGSVLNVIAPLQQKR